MPFSYNIIDVISDAVIVVDASGRIVFINAAGTKFKNLHDPPLEVGGLILDSVRSQWKEITRGVIERVMSSRIAVSFETKYSINGKRRFYDVTCNPIVGTDDNVFQVIIEIRDITVQKIFESKIKESVFERTSLIEYANVLIMGVDTQGYITEWNNFAATITGFSKNESLAKNFADLLLDRASQEVFSDLISRLLLDHVVSNCELSIRAKNFRQINILVNATSRKNADKEVVGILIIAQDITELSEYKRSLEEKVHERTEELHIALEKEKELVEIRNRFVSIASHEFRSPIAVIVRQAESLIKLIAGTHRKEAASRVESILHKANHMSALLEDVLLIGRGEASRIEPNIQPIELVAFFETTIFEVQTYTNGSHAIKTSFPFDVMTIESDESLLRNIFINLLNNAVKFSPDADEVLMSIDVDDSFVEMRIVDRGIGISAQDLKLIFQPFNRGGNARDIKGTGLGLSIVKKAVESLGGKIIVVSEVGVGSTFTVRLKRIYGS